MLKNLIAVRATYQPKIACDASDSAMVPAGTLCNNALDLCDYFKFTIAEIWKSDTVRKSELAPTSLSRRTCNLLAVT
jgi:hypothetical protein